MQSDPPMELGGEWLTEAERRDKSSRNESWRSNQHKIRFEQAKDFERLNADFNPTQPLDDDTVSYAVSVSDADASNIKDNESVDSLTPCCDASEGATYPQIPSVPPTPKPPKRSVCQKGPNPPPAAQSPRRSSRFQGKVAGLNTQM